jgi:single-strand DNA-binding protein
MATFNQAQFIGRLGKDPELNVTSSGKPYTRFSLAVDQGKDQSPLWLNIVTWDKLAETVEMYAHKGMQVFVQGKLQVRSYTDKDKVNRQAIEIIAFTIQLLEKRSDGATTSTPTEVDPFLPDFSQE